MYLSLQLMLKVMTIYTFISLSLCNTATPYKQISSQLKLEDRPILDSMPPPKPGWIDPYDMLGDSRSRDSLFVQSDVDIHLLQKRCDNYDIYLRRFVNLFLNAVQWDTPLAENSMNTIKLEFKVHGRDIKTLKEFGQDANNINKINAVSDVFSKIFSQKTAQDRNVFSIEGVLMWFQKATLRIISSPEWTVLSSVVLMLFLSLWFIYKTHSYRLALFTVFLTIFLAGFGFTWIKLYEEKEVEKFVTILVNGPVPRHCSSEAQSMAWYEHIYYRMFGVDCLEFYKTRDVRPIVKVSPTDVLAETITSMIVNPAANIGSAYGNFVGSLMSHVPFWLKPVALPLSFIVPLGFIIILLAFLFNYRLGLSITGFHLIPSWDHTSHSIMGKESQYVEDCPRKENNNLEQSNGLNSILSSTNAPVFIMNWMGIKKLSSSRLLGENSNKNKNEDPKQSSKEEEDNHSLEDDEEVMMAHLNNFKEFVKSVESQKAIEECKEGVHSWAEEEESSLTSRRSNLQSKPPVECTDLYSDKNKTSTSAGREIDKKYKTT